MLFAVALAFFKYYFLRGQINLILEGREIHSSSFFDSVP